MGTRRHFPAMCCGIQPLSTRLVSLHLYGQAIASRAVNFDTFKSRFQQKEDMFTRPKYAPDGREEIIKQYFGDAPLDKNLKEVFVTSYDIEQRIPIFFTNKIEKQQTNALSC